MIRFFMIFKRIKFNFNSPHIRGTNNFKKNNWMIELMNNIERSESQKKRNDYFNGESFSLKT
jgi:hypothetical protein